LFLHQNVVVNAQRQVGREDLSQVAEKQEKGKVENVNPEKIKIKIDYKTIHIFYNQIMNFMMNIGSRRKKPKINLVINKTYYNHQKEVIYKYINDNLILVILVYFFIHKYMY